MEIIKSRQNPSVIAAGKLSDKKYRELTGTFAFEGVKLFADAVKAGVELAQVFATEAAYEKYNALLCQRKDILRLVSEEVYEKLSFEKAPQGIFCVAKTEKRSETQEENYLLLLDGVSDPGNLGAVLRSAEAFGVDAVYVGADCADLYSPKTVRAAMGSLFRVKLRTVPDLEKTVKDLQKKGFRVVATALSDTAESIWRTDLSGKLALVIGNEGHGISKAVLDSSDKQIIIPMREGPESLNAAVATGIVLYETARRRGIL